MKYHARPPTRAQYEPQQSSVRATQYLRFFEYILSQRGFILVTSLAAYDPLFRRDLCKFLSPGSVEMQAGGPNPSTPV
jgi:hypothetical protein